MQQTKAAYISRDGQLYDYCGKTHAEEADRKGIRFASGNQFFCLLCKVFLVIIVLYSKRLNSGKVVLCNLTLHY